MCFGLGCEHEDRLTGECGYRGFGYPCTAWPDSDDEPEEAADAEIEGDDE